MKEPHSEWKEVDLGASGPLKELARAWQHKTSQLFVMRSLSTTEQNEKWIHVSVSHPDRVPTWEEFINVRDCFVGKDIEAYQVLPALVDYVNVCKYALHFWVPIDGKRRVANLRDLICEKAL